MTISDREGRIFLSHPNAKNGLFFFLTTQYLVYIEGWKYLTWVKTEIPIWCARKVSSYLPFQSLICKHSTIQNVLLPQEWHTDCLPFNRINTYILLALRHYFTKQDQLCASWCTWIKTNGINRTLRFIHILTSDGSVFHVWSITCT